MPETTITINRDQRDGLYEVICNHLSLVQDFWVAMERTKDGATAGRLDLEFAEDFDCCRTSAGARRTSARRST